MPSDGEGRKISRGNFIAIAGAVSATIPAQAQDVPHELGAPRRAYGSRSPFEKAERFILPGGYPGTGSARTPLQDIYGVVTPSALHFERVHAGVPTIDPAHHELLIDGLVETPLIFTVEDLRRMPSVSRMHFIECAGNSSSEQGGEPGGTPQRSHGLLSCSEWTGVPLRDLLQRVGINPAARWIYAEGADACRLARSIPIEKALDDVIVAYGQNGEALRPEQGYPLRLVVPGWEGNVNIKWLRTLQVIDQPAMTRDEAAAYTDLMPDGRARQFTFVMEAKSVITRPAGGHQLGLPGLYDINGLAWSGHGRIVRVDVTVDSGATWQRASLQEPVLSKAVTPFQFPWVWDGRETTIASRCIDETGYVQPTREELIAARGLSQGPDGFDHYNGIKWWRIHTSGKISA